MNIYQRVLAEQAKAAAARLRTAYELGFDDGYRGDKHPQFPRSAAYMRGHKAGLAEFDHYVSELLGGRTK